MTEHESYKAKKAHKVPKRWKEKAYIDKDDYESSTPRA